MDQQPSTSSGVGRSDFFDNSFHAIHGGAKKEYRELSLDTPIRRVDGQEFEHLPRDRHGRLSVPMSGAAVVEENGEARVLAAPRNVGAYDELESLLAQGVDLADALDAGSTDIDTQASLSELVGTDPVIDEANSSDPRFNVVTPATLQREGFRPKGGSKTGRKHERTTSRAKCECTHRASQHAEGGGRCLYTTAEAGSKGLRCACEVFVAADPALGRPLIGDTPRERLDTTVQPSTKVELAAEAQRRGISVGQLLDIYAADVRARISADYQEGLRPTG